MTSATNCHALWLGAVARALDAAPARVPFFFRDDDAGWADERLLALLDAFAAHSTWVDVAVIPRELGPGLARELAARQSVGLHQHGLAHVNHEREGRKCEFGPSRGATLQRADIVEGRARLLDLLGARVDPIFTPPWNRCTRHTGICLAALGFRALSRESRAEPLGVPGLLELPVCADWVRLDPDALGGRLASAIGTGRPVGVMFHHAEMDGASLRRAGDLLSLLAGHGSATTKTMPQLLKGDCPL